MDENFVVMSNIAKSFFAVCTNDCIGDIRLECCSDSDEWFKMESIRPNQYGVYYYDLTKLRAKHIRIAYSKNMELKICESTN